MSWNEYYWLQWRAWLWSASLWGCELKYNCGNLITDCFRSASLWGCELKWTAQRFYSESYFVSLLVRLWVEMRVCLLLGMLLPVSLLVRLWVEMHCTVWCWKLSYRQPPCEAVSWNILWQRNGICGIGQPPCEAVSWNIGHYSNSELEKSQPPCEAVSWNVDHMLLAYADYLSASLWGCELKYISGDTIFSGFVVSLLVRLWVEIGVCITAKNVCYVSLLVRLWVEIQLSSKHLKFAWVSLLVRLWVEIPYWSGWNDNVLVSLLVRLWVEIRNRKRPTSQMWSASLWGCELKCRVPRIWLFHCNRQIILRSGIKSLQPFERWSNLLQVTCDLW